MIKAIGILLPIALAIIEFLKKIFNLGGWWVRLVGVLVAAVMSIGYGLFEGYLWYQIVALGIGLWMSVCGGFDWLKEFVKWLGEGLKT